VFEDIRRAREREGLSIRELARRFGVHRRDVRRALASPLPPPRRKVPARPAPKMDCWKPVIDAWLEADRKAPRKQRHTARRVWQRLRDEHQVVVGESTVRRYVAEVRSRQEVSVADVMVPQQHRLGDEGEIDFGTITAKIAGVELEVSLFVMRLSASGRSFARAYLSEAQEVFLDGHVHAFNHFGGCPSRIRYDNLKAAVQKMLTGRNRIESERFTALRSHYGFDSFFCLPGIKGSHEKGGVESEVGRFRRRHLVPVPQVASMSELNELIVAGCLKDDRRHIAQRRISVGEHFALEAPELRALPAEPFDVSSVSSHRVDRKSRVSVRSAHYSVPVRYVGRRVDVRVGADTIEVLDGAAVVAHHVRGLQGDEVLALDHYLEVLVIKPGAMAGSTALARARAGGVFTDSHQHLWDLARRKLGDAAGTRALIDVLLLHRTMPASEVTTGIERALKVDSIDPNVIAIEARRASEPDTAVVIPIGEGLHRFDRAVPSIARYDQLLKEAQ
jgi:transposase